MFIKIDFKSKIPIYLQLRNQIVQGIATGELVKGETLPPVRQLAQDLGVNMHTISKSYKLLQRENYVSIYKRKGVQVNSFEELKNNDFVETLSEKIQPLLADAHCRGISKKNIIEIIENIYTNFIEGNK